MYKNTQIRDQLICTGHDLLNHMLSSQLTDGRFHDILNDGVSFAESCKRRVKMKKKLAIIVVVVVAIIAVFAVIGSMVESTEDAGSYSENYGDESEGGYEDGSDEYAEESVDDGYDSHDFSYVDSSLVTERFGDLGSASEVNGTTVVVTIFADDAETSWSNADSKLRDYTLKSLGIACDWITNQVAKYNCDATFIYDWKENNDLAYEMSFGGFATEEGAVDSEVEPFVSTYIDTVGIMDKYDADNIIYLFAVNTPLSNEVTSSTMFYQKGYYSGQYEYCLMFMGISGMWEAPSGFAHEMLHTFGAPDLYMADPYGDNFGITEDFVQYNQNTHSNDIMYTIYDPQTDEAYSDKIVNELSELDAYYIGLTGYSETVKEWGFKKSQHMN